MATPPWVDSYCEEQMEMTFEDMCLELDYLWMVIIQARKVNWTAVGAALSCARHDALWPEHSQERFRVTMEAVWKLEDLISSYEDNRRVAWTGTEEECSPD